MGKWVTLTTRYISGNSISGHDTFPLPNFPKEYNAVIELPYNISDVLGDDALVIDIDVPDVQPEAGFELALPIHHCDRCWCRILELWTGMSIPYRDMYSDK